MFLMNDDVFCKSSSICLSQTMSAILYMADNCDVKLLVAATPISGPQFSPTEIDEICARDEVIVLMIDSISVPFSFAIFTASMTSALSPLWDNAMRVDLLSK